MSNSSAVGFTRAVIFERYGAAESVLEFREISLPEPGAGEVSVALEAAVVHPSDFGVIAGTYGRPRTPPAVAGREGVGRVERVGPGVTRLKPGDRVMMPADSGVWRERGIYHEGELTRVPGDLPPEAAAQSFVNAPTAVRLLTDFVSLNPGDMVVQNAGNSAVSRAVAFLGARAGLRVVSLVRDVAAHEGALRALGVEAVLADNDEAPKRIAALRGGSSVRLALNSVGGASVMRLIKACDDGATVVTFGGMAGEPVRYPTRELIFKDLRLRGFWLDRWWREATPAQVEALRDSVFSLWREGFPIAVEAVYPLADIHVAVKHAAGRGRSGKVILRGPAWV